MYNNTHKSGKSIKSMALVSLALFVSQGAAKNLGSFSALRDMAPSGTERVKEAVQGIKISSSDPLVAENDEYLDWMEFASKALKHLTQNEITELIAEVPEFEILNQASPFDRNKVIAMIDDQTGEEIKESDIQELMQMSQMMQDRFGSDHHRKLQVAETIGETVVTRYAEKGAAVLSKSVIGVLKKLDPVIWRIKKQWDDMNNYDKAYGSIKEAEAATDSDFTKDTLNEADELKVNAQKQLYTSYRWLKTSARLLYKLLQRVERKIRIRDFNENQMDLYLDKLTQKNEMTEKEREEQTEKFYALSDEVDKLYDEIWETEQEAQDALETFGNGIETSAKYLGEAEALSTDSRRKVNLVKDYLLEKKEKAHQNVLGKSEEYDDFAETQRAIAYGVCAGVCGLTGIATGGTSCAICYGTAAAVLETKLADFREKNRKMMEKYHNMSDHMQVVLDRIFDMIGQLNTLDEDVEGVAALIKDARMKYKDIHDGGIEFLTEEAGEEDGTFTVFMEMLENTINYERNLQSCGSPDCRSTCMQEPIVNEGSDYKGCWAQTKRGEKCKNWTATEFGKQLGDNNSCRDPDNKGNAWCFIEDESVGQTWDYCVDF